MPKFLDAILAPSRGDTSAIRRINALRTEFASLTDSDVRAAWKKAASDNDLFTSIAATAVAAERVLHQSMFDVQLRGALALTRGSIAEMATGEGKTLAAVPAIAWYARTHAGVHVMTANDYLARRDAQWMGGIFQFLGLTVGFLQQGMTAEQRRAAYACDVMYSTANEIGFDFLRDRLALRLHEQVQRQFASAVIDEVDSILIDEARIPLVIAGGDADESSLADAADKIVRGFRAPLHCTVDTGARNVALTDAGIAAVERAFACGNLYEERNYRLLTSIQDALHAHILLHLDIDYIVKNDAIEMVDQFKGRVALDRRWPAGIHTAVEAKEGVAEKRQGMILGSITLQHLVALYEQVCGMTGTAATQALEFEKIYGMKVEVIPTNRPMIRVDHEDAVFPTRADKERAVVAEINKVHATGQAILVGTGSVEESERLSTYLRNIPHEVLNARQDENEAAVIAKAGKRGAVTISTNMAGRGTDIRLADGAAEAGGLYLIGTNKHESRRIDNQLRGRSGRQGDPGCSRFFISLEDDLMVKYGDIDPSPEPNPTDVQRLVEGRHLDARMFLQRYELPIEGQRHRIHTMRQKMLEDGSPGETEGERIAALRAVDDLWADYLARLAEFRAGLPWLNWGLTGVMFLAIDRRDAQYEYAQKIHQWFTELEAALPIEIEKRVTEAKASGAEPQERGAVWTYIVTDQPFGGFAQRLVRGFKRIRSK